MITCINQQNVVPLAVVTLSAARSTLHVNINMCGAGAPRLALGHVGVPEMLLDLHLALDLGNGFVVTVETLDYAV